MFDLVGLLKSKSGIDGDALTVPQSVQEVLQIKAVYPDGIFMVGKELFSKMFQFSDINYAVSSRKDKEDEFFKYSEILNSLENGVSTQITIINRKISDNELSNIMLSEHKDDGKDEYRQEINEMLSRLATGANAIVQDKYITLTIQKKTVDDARQHFRRVSTDLQAHFGRLGSKCRELDLTERLRVLHDFCRPGEEADYHFDLRDTMRKGQDFRDYISPDSYAFKSDHFRIGDKFARVLFIRDYPSYIKDSVIMDLTDNNRSMIFNYDIIPVSTEEAQKFGEKQALGIETNIANYQRRQNSNNNYTSVIPYDMEQQRKEIREFLNDITSRDQKMFKVILTILHTADTLEQLNADTEAIKATGRKHMCQIGTLNISSSTGSTPHCPSATTRLQPVAH